MDMKQVKTAGYLLLLFTFLTGLVYPLAITGLAQLLFPWQANGSFIKQEGKIIGSKWIGQSFTSPDFFHGRPSLGSNFALTNPMLKNAIQTHINSIQQLNPENHQSIPIDLVTNSASGLDPDISPAAAYYQVLRIARTRGISNDALNRLIDQHTARPCAGFIGEPRVNVLALNIALLSLTQSQSQPIESR
jgi:K+-transporting ATPase ATPase C chain